MTYNNELAESQRLEMILEKFHELNNLRHSVRIALDKLQTLDSIRIIAGKT